MNRLLSRLGAVVMAIGLVVLVVSQVQSAVIPPNPMMTGGQAGELGMYHGMISINPANEIVVHLGPGMSPAGNTPELPLKFTPDTHPDYTDESGTGGPDWTVLNGRHFNAQLGWIAENAGTWTVPSGSAVWIEPISVTGPGTLEVLEGGQGATSPLLPMDQHTLDPIFVGGQPWKWFDRDIADSLNPPFIASGSGIMTHNWYVTDTPGLYEVQYRIYVGDATTGVLDPTYTPAQVNVAWVPEPASTAIVLLGTLALVCRRGRNGQL